MSPDGDRDPGPALDETIHHPSRLAVAAFLSACAEADFATVRDRCGLSDSALSKIATALEAAGYVRIRKGHVGRRPRTWLSLAPAGRDALVRHIAALQQIADSARGAGAAVAGSADSPAGRTARDTGGPRPVSPAGSDPDAAAARPDDADGRRWSTPSR